MHATRTTLVTATPASAVIFLGMTVDSVRKMPARTHSDQISEEVIAGKRLWQHYDCNDCHTILGIGGYYAPDASFSEARKGCAAGSSMCDSCFMRAMVACATGLESTATRFRALASVVQVSRKARCPQPQASAIAQPDSAKSPMAADLATGLMCWPRLGGFFLARSAFAFKMARPHQ